MRVVGSFYIWINKYVWSRIDRVLCNEVWLNNGYVVVEMKEFGLFDYYFIFI